MYAMTVLFHVPTQIEAVKRSRFERRSQQIGRVFDDYRQWVKDTLTPPNPSLGCSSWLHCVTRLQYDGDVFMDIYHK